MTGSHDSTITVYHRDDAGCPEAHTHSGGPWYFEPQGWDGDVYSQGYPTREAAQAAADLWESSNGATAEVQS